MKRYLSACAAALALCFAGGAAEAATVVYEFSVASDVYGHASFEFHSESFIPTDQPTFLTGADTRLKSCALNGQACNFVGLYPEGDALDLINIVGGGWGVGFEFRNGAFAEVGMYEGFANSTLIVSTAAVPEPAAWALMIGGFGLVGGALRRLPVAAAA